MGIDARLLIRTTTKVTEDLLKLWSWDLCSSLDAKHFFINPEKGHLAIERTGQRYYSAAPGTFYHQDGPEIKAEPGETLLEVRLCTRYYGIGYERGDLPIILAVSSWCEQNIPNSSVWYGGDSSGVCAKPFNREMREELLRHYLSPKGRDYFNYRDRELSSGKQPPSCSNCVPSRKPNRYSWGGSGATEHAKFYCVGCGTYFTTSDGGTTWERKKKDDNGE